MKKVLFLMSIAAIFAACGGSNNKVDNAASELNVDQLMEKAETHIGKVVTVNGIIDHVCAHGGGKMFMVCEAGTNKLKVEPAGDLQAFNSEMEGSKYSVTGTLEELRITPEYLDNWEKETANDTAAAAEKGHDETSHGENADMGEHKPATDKIEMYRKEIAASEKGYISFYTLKATKLVKLEAAAKEEIPTEETPENE